MMSCLPNLGGSAKADFCKRAQVSRQQWCVLSLPFFPGPQGSVGHPLLHSFLYSANPWAVPGAGDLATEIEEPRERKKCRALGQSNEAFQDKGSMLNLSTGL